MSSEGSVHCKSQGPVSELCLRLGTRVNLFQWYLPAGLERNC